MKLKKVIIPIIILLVILCAAGTIIGMRVKSQIHEIFKMNDALKAEGYYMVDFEYKMLSFSYYLDKGHFIKALTGVNKLYEQLQTKNGLIKIPEFKSKEEEMEFYLNLQNPKTGAFMDDSYPYFTYNEPTENILMHLDELAKETGKPLRLKYPLKYLDQINTPEKLNAFLDEVSHVGWIGNKFPQTTFFFARSILSNCNGEGFISQDHLYEFSPEWKRALVEWFYNNQDPETGFWGPKSGRGHLLRKDLTNTASIIKAFVDNNGKDLYKEFPLKYRDKMFATALEVLSEVMPSDDDLSQWHEWSLKMGKGNAMIIRYLWKYASAKDKAKAEGLFNDYVRVTFEKFYISEKGTFSYNPNSPNATLDGFGKVSDLNELGFFLPERQKYLWGNPEINIIDLGRKKVLNLSKNDFDEIGNAKGVNSIRVYQGNLDEGNLTSNVSAVIYPHKTPVLDALDLEPKIMRWVESTSQSMGNWTSKDNLLNKFGFVKTQKVSVYDNIPYESIDHMLQKGSSAVIVGFDLLQVPRYKIIFELKK